MRILWYPEATGSVQPTIPPEPITDGPNDLSKITILVVDDASDWRRDNSEYLSKEFSCKVLTATDVDEALTVLQTNKVDLIVSDLNMGEKGGLDLARQRPQNIPFILISNHLPSDLDTNDLNIRAKIRKGDMDTLTNTIRNIFRDAES